MDNAVDLARLVPQKSTCSGDAKQELGTDVNNAQLRDLFRRLSRFTDHRLDIFNVFRTFVSFEIFEILYSARAKKILDH